MLDQSHAARAAAVFGLGAARSLDGPVAHGRLGSVWRLETDRGAYALKVSHTEPGVERAERDAAYQAAFRAAGVPMPPVHRTTDGSVLGHVGGSTVRVYGWVEVVAPDRGLDPASVGRLLAATHRVDLPVLEAVDDWYTDEVGEQAWSSLVDDLHRAEAPFAAELAALVPQLVELETTYAAPAEAAVCHRDLWADNLRAAPAGGLVALDWENAGLAGRGQELGVLLFEFGLGDPARVRALVAAYEDAGGPGRLCEPGDLTMLLAQQGHLVQVGCRRWLAATDPAERASNEAWVREFLDDPALAPEVEGLLRAARPRT